MKNEANISVWLPVLMSQISGRILHFKCLSSCLICCCLANAALSATASDFSSIHINRNFPESGLYLPEPIAPPPPCENLSMQFDSGLEYIELNTSATLVSGNANFTLEARFSITQPPSACVNPTSFNRLFAVLNGAQQGIEIGECNGNLAVEWITNTPGNNQPYTVALNPGCHHIAAVRMGNLLTIYLDGALAYTTAGIGSLNTSLLRVGYSGGAAPGWKGEVDEVRLWFGALSLTEIQSIMDCTLNGAIPNLVANWTFDESPTVVTPGGNNTAVTTVTDMSTNGNHGILNQFALNGSLGNFICHGCPPKYDVIISDNPSLFPIGLAAICSGTAAHFCIASNGITVGPIPNAVIDWEYSDNGGTWTSVNDPYFTGFCFYVPQGDVPNGGLDITAYCSNPNHTSGYVDRTFRARITKTITFGAQQFTCSSVSSETVLSIYCPITNATVSVPPVPLCDDGTSQFVNVALQSADPFVLPNLGSTISVSWWLNGTPLGSSYDNLPAFQYPVSAPKLCFQAVITSFLCPTFTTPQACVSVDPDPVCGMIDGISANLIPTSTPFSYFICPDESAELAIISPFSNCGQQIWQYYLDTDPPSPDPWKDLGSSNSHLNTNILPQFSPPNHPLSPYLWQPNTQCIYYRVKCLPLSWPYSGCDSCYSNTVTICLQPDPPNAVISGNSQFCYQGSNTLTVSPYNQNYTYTWCLNGLPTNCVGQTCNATQPGCYTVKISDQCKTVVTPPFCTDQCKIVAEIACPTDNPCACDGMPITLDGSGSYDICLGTGPLTYSWSSNTSSNTSTSPIFTDIPDPNGTTYTLQVCNSLNPACCATTTLVIKPCIP